ncbi:MAG: sialidase family protein, partial [Chloroflexota bacterium]
MFGALRIRTVWLMVALIICVLFVATAAFAQDSPNVDWSYPAKIPQYHKDSRAPTLVADRSGKIHGLTIDTGDGKVLAYRTWTEDVGWTIPVDVVLPPAGGSAVILGAEVDNNDRLHVIAFYGVLGDSGIYHTSVPVALAASGNEWEPMTLVVSEAGPTPQGFFTTNGDGLLNVIFQGEEAGLGIYEAYSEDNGVTWSNAQVVYLAPGDLFQPSAVDMHLGLDGDLHAVWSLWNAEQGVGEQIIYSQKSLETNTWSRPVVIAERDESDYESDWAAVTTIDDRILVLYQDDNPATKYMRFSPNDGSYWSEPQRIWPHIGEYENAVLLKDNQGGLHAILGNRSGDCCHGMWYSKYEDQQWTNLQSLIQGPKTVDFDPSAPSAVISQGNLLMASWWMDSSDRNGAWYSYGYLENLVASPLQELNVPSDEVIADENSTENLLDPSTEETNNNQIPEEQITQEQVSSPATPMTIGIIFSLIGLLIGFAIWFTFSK